MKLELRKTVKKLTGDVFYNIFCDDSYVSGSCELDKAKAEAKFAEMCENALKYPEDTTTVVDTFNPEEVYLQVNEINEVTSI